MGYKTMVKPDVVYKSGTQLKEEMDMKRMNTLEREILMRIYGPVVEQGIWRIRNSQELRELYKDLDIVVNSTRKG
jgi:hypothetical protein